MKTLLILFSNIFIAVSFLSADPGESTVINVCTQDPSFELIAALQGTPDPGGVWTDPDGIEVVDGLYDPGVSPVGIYTYTVDGTEGGESATVEISEVNCSGSPANNECFSAQFINPANEIPFSTFGATTDGLPHMGEENCEVDGESQIENDVWFLYSAACDGNATVSTVGGTILDTKIAVYTFACPPTTDELQACNEDFGAGYQSSVTWEIEEGGIYLIRIGESPGPGSGNGTFNLTEICFGEEPPENQYCEDAITVSANPAIPFSTFNAETDGPSHEDDNTCSVFGSGQMTNDIWFSYTATCEGTATMSTLGGTTLDTRIAVYADFCPVDLSNLITCNDDHQGFGQSQVSWDISPGDQFILRIGNDEFSGGGAGTFSLTENCGGEIPENDFCSNAVVIEPAIGIPFNNVEATTDGPSHFENIGCTFFGGAQIDKDLWYEYTAGCDGIAEVTTVNGTFLDTRLAVYAEYCPNDLLNLVVCNDDDGGTQSTVEWNVVEGYTYYIRLGEFPGSGGGSGTFNLTETCMDVCAMPVIGYQTFCNGLNDFQSFFVSATVVTIGNSGPYQVSSSIGGYTEEISESGVYNFGPFNNDAVVFFNVESLEDEICTDVSYELTVDCYPDNYNFTCGDVFPAFTNQYTSYTNEDSFTWGDTLDTDDCGFNQIHNDLWYVYSAACSGEVTWNNCALSDFSTRMAVYENTCESGNLELIACSEPDTCGEFAASLTFTANQGENYVFRLGSTAENESGIGVFIIEEEIEMISAGADSTIYFCTDFTGTVILPSYLNGAEPNGEWLDTDSSGGLVGNVVILSNLDGSGVYQYTYQVSGPCNDDAATITIHYDICDRVPEVQAEKIFEVFPNPATDRFGIRVSRKISDLGVVLYNVSGRQIISRNFSVDASGILEVKFGSELSTGMYFIRIMDEQNGYMETHKLIVRNPY